MTDFPSPFFKVPDRYVDSGGKNVKVNEKPTEELRMLGEIATTKARIYVDFKGTEANTGSIGFSTVVFNVVWPGDEIFNVSTMEYSTCVKRLMKTFDTARRYPQKC